MKYHAQFLGEPAFFANGRKICFPFQKALILTLLLVEEGALHRDRIASLLWGDKTTESARRNLSNAISAIRKLIPIFISSGRSLGLDRKVRVTRDVDLIRGMDSLSWEQVEPLLHPYLDLPKLDDWPGFSEWLRERRSHYHRLLIQGLRNRADLHLHHGTEKGLAEGIRCYEKLSELEPCDETINGELTRLYIKADRKIDALQVARAFSRRVEEDLGMPPDHRSATFIDERSPRLWESMTEPPTKDNPLFRNEELLRLLDFFCCTDCAQESQCALLWGEEGIGKGSLIRNTTARLEKEGWTCLHLRCYQEEMNRPMAPFYLLMHRLDCRFPRELGSQSQAELGYLRVAEVVTEQISQIERDGRCLLVVENLQWMDNASWMILESILWNDTVPSTLLISGYEEIRSTFMLRTEIAGEPIETLEIHLERFGFEETARICRLLRPDTDWSEQQLAEIYNQTQGNPFFIDQTLNTAPEPEAGTDTGDGEDGTEVPNLYTARIQLMDEKERLVLEGLSLLPAPAQLSQICELLELTPLEISRYLERTPLQGLLREHRGEEGEVYYYFTHPKVRDALAENMSPTRTAALQRKAIAILEEQCRTGMADGDRFAALAGLCREEGLRDKEIHWRLRELQLHFKAAHEVFPSLSDQELARCIPAAEDTGYTEHSIDEIRSLLNRQIRRHGRTPERSTMERQLFVLHGGYLWWSGHYEEAGQVLGEAYRMAAGGSDRDRAEALLQLCYLAIQTDNRKALAISAGELYRRARASHLHLFMGSALRFLAILRIMEGRPNAARRLLQMSTRVFEKLEEEGMSYTLPIIAAEHFRGDLGIAEGDIPGALGYYENCNHMAESIGIHRGMGLSLAKAGYCLYLLGEFDEAERVFSRIKAFYSLLNSEQDGSLQGGGIAFSLMGLMEGLKGNWQKSREHFTLAERFVTTTRRPTWTAILYWAKAELLREGNGIPERIHADFLPQSEQEYREWAHRSGAWVGWIR
ncbi:MAG: AAA family ATPase [Synergistales bacterium]|nr:AAA family ATPase [Synergistales bacterium]